MRRAERNRSRVEQQLRLLKRTPRPQDYPRSRRLIAQNRQPYAPVGWVQMEVKPFKEKFHLRETLESDAEYFSDIGDEEEQTFQEKLKQLKKKFGK